MPVETENHQEILYQAISSVIQIHSGRKRVVFGIMAEFIGETTEMLRIRDISTNKNDVLRLILLLTEFCVSKEHFFDVVEDFVQELHM